MKKLSKIEAVEKWMNKFNEISKFKIERLFENERDNFIEHTPIIIGDTVRYKWTQPKVIDAYYKKNNDCGFLDTKKSKLTLKLDVPEIETISANKIDSIYYEDEAVEVKGITDNFEFIIIYGEELKIPFNDVKEVEYDGLERMKINKVIEDKFEIELSEFVTLYGDKCSNFSSWLPAYETMWIAKDSSDISWIKENPEVVAKCGFRIFEDDVDGDIMLGTTEAVCDFYKANWISLYEARGLKWHKED